MSVLSGAHMTLFAWVPEPLKENDASEVVVFGGGTIPEDDAPALHELVVSRVCTPEAGDGEIGDW